MLKINKILKNFCSVGFANIISQFLAFLSMAYYARILSPKGFGQISLVQAIIVYFTMITLYGFQTYGTREVTKYGSSKETLVKEITSLRLIIAFFSFVVILFMAFFINKGGDFKLLLIISGLTVFPLAFNIDWLFSGLCEMQYNAVYNVLKNIIPFILVIIFLKNKEDIYLIPLFTLLGILIAVFYQAYIYSVKKGLKYKISINKKSIINYLGFGFPFFVSGLLSMINCNVDSIIIGFVRGEVELGIYSSAYKIIFFLTNLISIVFIPVFPLFISYYNENKKKELERLITYTGKMVTMLALPICIGGILLSKEIIILLFGKEFSAAYKPLIILLIYILVLFMREIYAYGLNAWNMEKKYVKVVAISSAMNLVGNLIFIPIYGMQAAAIITLLSELVNLVFMKKYASTVIKFSYVKSISKDILPTALMAVSIITMKYLGFNIIINIIVAIIVYFVGILLFRYVTIDEIRKLKSKDV